MSTTSNPTSTIIFSGSPLPSSSGATPTTTSISKYPKDFIQEVLIDGIGGIINAKKENGDEQTWHIHAFALMGIGIEFLGKCIDTNHPNDWHVNGQSRINFEYAINNLNSFSKYKPLVPKPYDMYSEFRCGLAHAFFSKSKIGLSHGTKESPTIIDISGNSNINCNELYHDFKDACNEVIAMSFIAIHKMNNPYIHVNYRIAT